MEVKVKIVRDIEWLSAHGWSFKNMLMLLFDALSSMHNGWQRYKNIFFAVSRMLESRNGYNIYDNSDNNFQMLFKTPAVRSQIFNVKK